MLNAEEMLWDLRGNSLEVVLIPAPAPKHSNHCIRAVQYANANWYRKFCSLYPGNRKRAKAHDTMIKRQWTEKALVQILEGKTKGVYVERLLEFIKTENDQIIKKKQVMVIESLHAEWEPLQF